MFDHAFSIARARDAKPGDELCPFGAQITHLSSTEDLDHEGSLVDQVFKLARGDFRAVGDDDEHIALSSLNAQHKSHHVRLSVCLRTPPSFSPRASGDSRPSLDSVGSSPRASTDRRRSKEAAVSPPALAAGSFR